MKRTEGEGEGKGTAGTEERVKERRVYVRERGKQMGKVPLMAASSLSTFGH